MAIVPRSYTKAGVEVYHEGRDHGGMVPWADLTVPTRATGTPVAGLLRLPCPVAGCGSESLIPREGGAHPDEGRALHEAYARYAGDRVTG